MPEEKPCDPHADDRPGWPLGLFISMLDRWRRSNLRVVVQHHGKLFPLHKIAPEGGWMVLTTRPSAIGEVPPPGIPEVVVSRGFPNAGNWIVHVAGPNRNPKLVFTDSQEDAEEFASRINALLRQVVEDHCQKPSDLCERCQERKAVYGVHCQESQQQPVKVCGPCFDQRAEWPERPFWTSTR